MSQERIRKLLLALDGEATTDEISKLAQKRYPDESLYRYISRRLQSMEKKGLVKKKNEWWQLTETGRNTKIDNKIDELDAVVCQDDLVDNYGVEICNIVGTLRLDNQLDLSYLSQNLKLSNYHPETYPNMIYKPTKELSVSLLVPASGKITIVGARSKQDLIYASRDFIKSINEFGIEVDEEPTDIHIQNIIAIYNINREIDLSALSVGLGLENVEYDPEQFPGLIYRGIGTTTIAIFRTGKVSIMGSKTYDEVVEALNHLTHVLEDLGMKLDLNANYENH